MSGTCQREVFRATAISLAFALAGPVACSSSSTGAGPRAQVLAPIDAAELVVRESFPPQYAVRIVSGLPSGCAAFDRIDVARDGTVIDVAVWNTVPADPEVACTMIYGTTENVAELGSDFEPDRTYDVLINGETRITFGAQ